MEKNITKKIVFLCSGEGGNLRFINFAISNNWIENATISSVITDRDCTAGNYARSLGVNSQQLNFDSSGQNILLETLDSIEPDIIVTNIHKILHKPIVDKFCKKLINLHYSLLPAFGGSIGINSIQKAVDYGAKFAGVTVHFVSSELDGGKPIVQAVIPLGKFNDDFDALSNVTFKAGCLALITAINLISPNKVNSAYESESFINIDDSKCLFSHVITAHNEINIPDVWLHVNEKYFGGIKQTTITGDQ